MKYFKRIKNKIMKNKSQNFSSVRYLGEKSSKKKWCNSKSSYEEYYYVGKLKLPLERQQLTEKEQKDHFQFYLIPLKELEPVILQNQTNNPRNKEFQREMLEIITFYKKEVAMERILKKEQEIK